MKFVTGGGRVKEYSPCCGCGGGCAIGHMVQYLDAHKGWILVDVGEDVGVLL